MNRFIIFFNVVRFIVIIAFVGWTAAALAIGSYWASIFFAAFTVFLFFTRKLGEAHMREHLINKDKVL